MQFAKSVFESVVTYINVHQSAAIKHDPVACSRLPHYVGVRSVSAHYYGSVKWIAAAHPHSTPSPIAPARVPITINANTGIDEATTETTEVSTAAETTVRAMPTTG